MNMEDKRYHLHFHIFGGEKVEKWFNNGKITRNYLQIKSIDQLKVKNKPIGNFY